MIAKLWKCEQMRAGEVYNRLVFDTREEAEEFTAQMQDVEPDLFWRIEAVDPKHMWN